MMKVGVIAHSAPENRLRPPSLHIRPLAALWEFGRLLRGCHPCHRLLCSRGDGGVETRQVLFASAPHLHMKNVISANSGDSHVLCVEPA